MPNWVFNELTIQGPKEQVDSIKNKLNSPYVKKHDNWNIEKQEMEVLEYTYSNPVFAFHNIYNHIEDNVTDEIYLAQPPRHLSVEEQMLFQTNDWYSWNVRNWGTKWDVAVSNDDKYPDTVLHEHKSEGEDQWLVYGFNTAWSPPVPAMEKLSALVPNCVVTLSYEEEQGWGGEMEFVNGKITANSEYESKCRDCDAEDTLDYCENDCGQICSKCNYLGEADLECVKECQTHKVYLDEEHVPEYRMEQI